VLQRVKVGDLVVMDWSDWDGGDEWGTGIVAEIDKDVSRKIAVLWSKIGLSWEDADNLETISAA